MHGALCVCWTRQDWVQLAEIVSLVHIFLFYPSFDIIPLVLDLTFKPNYYSWSLLGSSISVIFRFFCLLKFTGHVGPHHWAKSFPAGSDDKECLQCWRLGFSPWVGKIPGEGNGCPLQHSSLENSMDRGVWQAMVHGVVKSRTQLSD